MQHISNLHKQTVHGLWQEGFATAVMVGLLPDLPHTTYMAAPTPAQGCFAPIFGRDYPPLHPED